MWSSHFLDYSLHKNFNFGFASHKNDIHLYLSEWQYWWWFWFSVLWALYFIIIIEIVMLKSKNYKITINTSLKSHGKWGDFLVAIIPLSWCGNILINSNFILRMIEWQNEGSLFTVRIQGKQWYWVYKYSNDTNYNLQNVYYNVGNNNWQKFKSNNSFRVFALENTQLNFFFFQEFNDITVPKLAKHNRLKDNLFSLKKLSHTKNNILDTINLAEIDLDLENKKRKQSLNNTFSLISNEWYVRHFRLPAELLNRSGRCLYHPETLDDPIEEAEHSPVLFQLICTFLNKTKTNYGPVISLNNVLLNFEEFLTTRPDRLDVIEYWLTDMYGYEHGPLKNPIYSYVAISNKHILERFSKHRGIIPEYDPLTNSRKWVKNRNIWTWLVDEKDFLRGTNYDVLRRYGYFFKDFFTTEDFKGDYSHIPGLLHTTNKSTQNYHFDILEDTFEVTEALFIKKLKKPFKLLKGVLTKQNLNLLKNNLQLKSPLFINYKLNSKNIEEKVEMSDSFWGFRQKRYVKDDGLLDEFNTDRFNSFDNFTSHKLNNFYDCYNSIKINKIKNELIPVSLSRRLLRTKRTLMLPAHINITLVTNSYDVVHSWFVPGLGLKIDCVPGRSTHHSLYIDNIGFYYGQCAEICGRYHHHMPIRVCSVTFEHFLLWWHHIGLPRTYRFDETLNMKFKKYPKDLTVEDLTAEKETNKLKRKSIILKKFHY